MTRDQFISLILEMIEPHTTFERMQEVAETLATRVPLQTIQILAAVAAGQSSTRGAKYFVDLRTVLEETVTVEEVLPL